MGRRVASGRTSAWVASADLSVPDGAPAAGGIAVGSDANELEALQLEILLADLRKTGSASVRGASTGVGVEHAAAAAVRAKGTREPGIRLVSRGE
jgi:hypothetical protein